MRVNPRRASGITGTEIGMTMNTLRLAFVREEGNHYAMNFFPALQSPLVMDRSSSNGRRYGAADNHPF